MADYLPRSIMYASRMRYLKSREGGDRTNNRRGSLEMFATDDDTSGALGCLEIKEPCRWVGHELLIGLAESVHSLSIPLKIAIPSLLIPQRVHLGPPK